MRQKSGRGDEHARAAAAAADAVREEESLRQRWEATQETFRERFDAPIQRATHITKATLAWFPIRVWRHFLINNGFLLGAGISYQALFAIFAAIYVAFAITGLWLGGNTDAVNAMIALINSYIPPQPTLQRCATFGRALKGVLGRMGLRAAVIASGGLSHYPGTARYAKPGPDLDFDRTFFEGVRQHGPRYATWLDGGAAEQTGNLELRSWAMLAGLFGDGTERLAALEENWHHTYAVACWTKEEVTLDALAARDLYPPIRAENAALNRALFVLRNNYDARKLYQADAAGFVARYGFSAEAAAALAAMDSDALRDNHGGHPLLTSGAVRALQGMTY